MNAIKRQKVLIVQRQQQDDVANLAEQSNGKERDELRDRSGGTGHAGNAAEKALVPTPPAVAKSGVPQGLVGWGQSKLDNVAEANLQLALIENGLPQPQATEPNTALWAKNQLCATHGMCNDTENKGIEPEQQYSTSSSDCVALCLQVQALQPFRLEAEGREAERGQESKESSQPQDEQGQGQIDVFA
eukprot:3696433-Pleurochrysis_carterae.AAC.1